MTPNQVKELIVTLPESIEILCISANITATADPSKEFLIITGKTNTTVTLQAMSTNTNPSIVIEFNLSIYGRRL